MKCFLLLDLRPWGIAPWSVLGTLPLNGSFSLTLVKEAPVPGLSISFPSFPTAAHLPAGTVTSVRPQGFFTTSPTCCPDSQRPPSRPTWPPRCPLVDTLWGLLLAKSREGLRGAMSDLEIALGEGPGSEAGMEAFACACRLGFRFGLLT